MSQEVVTISVHPIMMDAPGYFDPRWKAKPLPRRVRYFAPVARCMS